jgi:protein SCO1/2
MTRGTFIIAAAVVAAIIVGVGVRLFLSGAPETGRSSSGEALVGGPFVLVDQEGRLRQDSDFRGNYMLVMFGYTFCPDVCPTTLYNVTLALDTLDEDVSQQIQPIFITVDPARDTVAAMRAYADNFHPRLVALTGSDDEIAAVAKAYRVYYAKADEGEDYLVDHTAFIYLMDSEGRYTRHFSHNTSVEDLAAALADLR